MKYIYQTILFAITASLIISLGTNFLLWKDIRKSEAYILDECKELKESNDELAQKLILHREFISNTKFTQFSDGSYIHLENEIKENIKSGHEITTSIQKYSSEVSRRELLEQEYQFSLLSFHQPNPIEAKKSYQDILHVGYGPNIINETKYELYINGKPELYQGGKSYHFPKDQEIKIEIDKISINNSSMKIDTVTAIKIIGA